jgi:SAM-dependent methyltransferase
MRLRDPRSRPGSPGPSRSVTRHEPVTTLRKMDNGDTSSASYTARLTTLESPRWKRVLDVQAPYRRNLRRLLGDRPTIDVGCGVGRNLQNLPSGSIGVDHNPSSVEVCRERGLEAYTTEEFRGSAAARRPFRGLLAAHLVEHLPRQDAAGVLAPYVELLVPDALVVLICPQERGYRSDPTHCQFFDTAELGALCGELGLTVVRASSFPLPRVAGRFFTYNEFVVVARRDAGSSASEPGPASTVDPA